ncbi:MAG: 4Fe-4S ferredoxin [Negativicutes bacterium]|nr:4Fe-4S ferredoxin [Negativicutes bacterium]
MSTKICEVGYLSEEELASLLPSPDRLAQGPVAVIECVQDIPCNPCEQACPFGAISVGQPITSLPVLAAENCRGCGLCIAKCPGLAIFVVDGSKPGEAATVQMPYEYQPLPKAGDRVWGLNRRGGTVVKGRVQRVAAGKEYDHTAVVTVEVPKAYVNEVRSLRPVKEG